MAKLKNPLLSLRASGSLTKALTFLRRRGRDIAEKKPEIKDVQTEPQLAWRHMFNKCVDLWHALSTAEKAEWESAARSRHMTGYAWYISQCLRPNPGIYLPLQGGTMSGDIDMAKHRLLKLPAPVDGQEPATAALLQAVMTAHIALPAVHHFRYTDAEAIAAAKTDPLLLNYTEGARVYHSTTQAVPHATPTVLAFNSERWDTDAIHDPLIANSHLTCKTAGKYVIIVNVDFDEDPTGIRAIIIGFNGLFFIALDQRIPPFGYHTVLNLSTIYSLTVNDFVEVLAYQDSGGPLNVKYLPEYSPEFMMQRVG